MEVLVTGGAGFIGSHLVGRLLAEGMRVRVFDNLSTGSMENLAGAGGADLVEGDITDAAAIGRAASGVDAVFHLAAMGSVPRSVEDPASSNGANVTGTLNTLIAARDGGAGRFVYSSSSSVYGDTPSLPKSEEMPVSPVSPYGVGKLAGEFYTRVFFNVYGLETISLRYFNVFGPRQSPRSQYAAVVPRFASAMLGGGRPVVYGDGGQSRDFTYVENVVEANVRALRADRGFGEAMNIAAGGRITLNRLLEMLGELTGSSAEAERLAPRPGDIRHSYASIDKAAEMIGYRPVVEFGDGLGRTVEWHRQAAGARS